MNVSDGKTRILGLGSIGNRRFASVHLGPNNDGFLGTGYCGSVAAH